MVLRRTFRNFPADLLQKLLRFVPLFPEFLDVQVLHYLALDLLNFLRQKRPTVLLPSRRILRQPTEHNPLRMLLLPFFLHSALVFLICRVHTYPLFESNSL